MPARAAEPLPKQVLATLGATGLPLKSFGFYVRPVDADAPRAFAALNAEQPFPLASTAKVVTSLAALDLLGATHQWRMQAVATGPLTRGRLAGDLVIAGDDAGLTPDELQRWFRQMRAEGLNDISGNIVLERFALLHEEDAAQAPTGAAEAAAGDTPDSRSFNRGALVVAVQATAGERASVSLTPQPAGVVVVNDVFMGGGCSAWAQWRELPRAHGVAPQLWVRGRWDARCGRRDIAFVRPPPSLRTTTRMLTIPTPRRVAALWTDAGGRLGGRVLESHKPTSRVARAAAMELWTSRFATPLPELIREINKTSNNLAARTLLRSLSPPGPAADAALKAAQDRVHDWLREQGLAEGDIQIDQGSGQSRLERGRPRAMVELLRKAWAGSGAKAFVDSLPIAGVDGTLAHRMRNGSAAGQAYLKTGTLRDTRALAGYVRGRSGKVYAVAAVVNHPQAARATPVLDAFIEWVARDG